ncbi:Uncharacterised protein [Escherichia coli]|nr:Uncharacterised protein [Escherichia coli]SQR74150.1 Uncharacterised protein [Escherichia coli]
MTHFDNINLINYKQHKTQVKNLRIYFNSEYNFDYYLHFGFIRQRLKRRQTYLFMCRLTSHIDLNQ